MKLINLLQENNIGKLWYHGSYSNDIKVFKTRRSVDNMGAYFTNDKEMAKRLHGSLVNYLYTVVITFKKLFNLSMYKEGSKDLEEFLKQLPVSKEYIRHYILTSGPYLLPYKDLETADRKENIIPKIKKKGYDSLAFNEDDAITMVVFDPNIIKIVKVESIK